MAEQKLKRNLSFISMIALASGAVIGGWLAEAPYWFSVTGTWSRRVCITCYLLPAWCGNVYGYGTVQKERSESTCAYYINTGRCR